VAGKYQGSTVAVKLLTAKYATARARTFIRNEVQMNRLIPPHPNIVPVQDVLKSAKGGVEGAVMPVCGENLAQVASITRLRNHGAPFTRFSAYLDRCHQVAQGMQHMHASGVVHLDLKESNLLLGPGGGVLIADFGLSAREGARLTSSRGTPGYTAPEILKACGAAGARVEYHACSAMDIYSAGATFFALMSAHPLTRDSNGGAAYSDLAGVAVKRDRAGAHVDLADEHCRAWLAMLQRCLQEDPQLRPTAAQLSALLAQLLQRVKDAEQVPTSTHRKFRYINFLSCSFISLLFPVLPTSECTAHGIDIAASKPPVRACCVGSPAAGCGALGWDHSRPCTCTASVARHVRHRLPHTRLLRRLKLHRCALHRCYLRCRLRPNACIMPP
jgi:serine/threonine protein kinase